KAGSFTREFPQKLRQPVFVFMADQNANNLCWPSLPSRESQEVQDGSRSKRRSSLANMKATGIPRSRATGKRTRAGRRTKIGPSCKRGLFGKRFHAARPLALPIPQTSGRFFATFIRS